MKTESKKSSAGKLTSCAIVALVLAGAAAISCSAEVSEKSTVMSKAFVFFVSAVIVVQVVPGLMLFGAMVKGVCSMAAKKVAVPVSAGSK